MEMNLQMFAENTQTTAGLSAEMKTYYGMELLENAKPQLVHNQFAATKGLPAGGGKTVEWRYLRQLHHQGAGAVRRLHHRVGYAGSDGHRRRGAGDH